MGTNEIILLKNQAGFESVRGTPVAATRKLYAQITPAYDRPLMDFADASGTYFARRRAAYGRERISFSATDIMTFEDGPWWAALAFKGGVTGVTDAGSPPAYTYDLSPTVDSDDLESMTLEFNEAGNPYESNQVMATQQTLRMDSDNDSEPGWMIDTELIGINWTPTTYTAALPERDTEVVEARGTKIYIDDGGGTIGTTQKLGSLINASITVQTGIHFKAFSENVTGFAAGKTGRGPYMVDAQFTFEFDSDTEFAKYRDATAPQQRLIRMESEGSLIHGTPNTYNRFRVDLWGYWSSWSRGDREGNLTATFGLAGFHDAVEDKTIGLEFVNSLSALP